MDKQFRLHGIYLQLNCSFYFRRFIKNNRNLFKNKDIVNPVAILLRKVKGLLERDFINELEKRIKNSEIRPLVVRSFSIAGTEKATNILLEHSEVWNELIEVGFLSSTFEDQLVEAIKSGGNEISIRAIQVISSRATPDRRRELIDLLPQLPADRAQLLATSLLLFQSSLEEVMPLDQSKGSEIFKCILHIKNKGKFSRT